MLKFQFSIYFLLVSIFFIYNAVFFNLFIYKQSNSDTNNNKFNTQIEKYPAIINQGIEKNLFPAA